MLLGIDIGSTTMKTVLCDQDGDIIYSDYRRHNTDIPATATAILTDMADKYPGIKVSAAFTGPVGMGYAEALGCTFVQEVICAAEVIRERYPEVHTLIDIGGEDSKMIFFEPGRKYTTISMQSANGPGPTASSNPHGSSQGTPTPACIS